ncbi:MAG TPA: NAD(P)H-hydrate epimerase [Candidatus Limnocylindrales bacterium]|nr:NAD(P)H-hydrate epimerase [Candidatus Limnocylindrales bacterium]
MSSSGLPLLSSAQVKQVDALCQERFGIPTDWLMEAAGWQVARWVDRPAAVMCGVGNNAGDGLATARHLHRWGKLAGVCGVDVTRLRGAAARELEALRRLGVEVASEPALREAEVVVDAIFGTGLTRAPEGRFAEWIEAINASHKHVIAIDVPSGLDADTGVAYSPAVRPDVVVTLGLPKAGLAKLDSEVWIVDIGVPFEAYAAIGVQVPAGLFASSDRVRL